MGEASLSLKVLWIGHDLWARSEDIFRPDPTRVSFQYEQRLTVPLCPASVINLFPVVHCLLVGAACRCEAFDPQIQGFAEVIQEVESFHEGPPLGVEPSFKVKPPRSLYLDQKQWLSVDPSLNQVGVDATHVKLVEGESWLGSLQTGKVVGRIKARVLNNASFSPEQRTGRPTVFRRGADPAPA